MKIFFEPTTIEQRNNLYFKTFFFGNDPNVMEWN